MKRVIIIFCIAALTCLFSGCSNLLENESTIPEQPLDETESNHDYEKVMTCSAYSLVKTADGYELYSQSDHTRIDNYTDYRELHYYDKENIMQSKHVLVKPAENGGYILSSLAEDSETLTTKEYMIYSFHEDYLLADGFLYDGNLNLIGPAYGEVTAVSSIEEGGMITFVETDDVIHSYFLLRGVEKPMGESALAYIDDYYNHGTDVRDAYIFLDNNYYIKTDDRYFELPRNEKANLDSYICTEDGMFVFLYYENFDMKNRRSCKISLSRDEEGVVYYHAVQAAIDSVHASSFGGYDLYQCSTIPDVQWYVGANSMFHAFYGHTLAVCDGKYLILERNGTTGNRYQLFNQKLKAVAAFNDDARMEDGKYHISFYETENSADLVSFWYDPQTKEAGIN